MPVLGNLGRAGGAAVLAVGVLDQVVGDGRAKRIGQIDRGGGVARGNGVDDGGCVFLDTRVRVGVEGGHLFEDLFEGRAAVSWFGREIGSPGKGSCGARQEHRQGPAAALAQGMQCGHVYLVDIGAFFSIDLDIDEPLVHEVSGFLVLEGFVRHHVAPVARGVTDR